MRNCPPTDWTLTLRSAQRKSWTQGSCARQKVKVTPELSQVVSDGIIRGCPASLRGYNLKCQTARNRERKITSPSGTTFFLLLPLPPQTWIQKKLPSSAVFFYPLVKLRRGLVGRGLNVHAKRWRLISARALVWRNGDGIAVAQREK